MSEFSEEMDDLFFWLDEVDVLLNTGIRPADRDFLQQLSDKLKVAKSEFFGTTCDVTKIIWKDKEFPIHFTFSHFCDDYKDLEP